MTNLEKWFSKLGYTIPFYVEIHSGLVIYPICLYEDGHIKCETISLFNEKEGFWTDMKLIVSKSYNKNKCYDCSFAIRGLAFEIYKGKCISFNEDFEQQVLEKYHGYKLLSFIIDDLKTYSVPDMLDLEIQSCFR